MRIEKLICGSFVTALSLRNWRHFPVKKKRHCLIIEDSEPSDKEKKIKIDYKRKYRQGYRYKPETPREELNVLEVR